MERAARAMNSATLAGCATSERWLDAMLMLVAPICLAMARCTSGRNALSLSVIRYHVGLRCHAACVTVSSNAAAVIGCWTAANCLTLASGIGGHHMLVGLRIVEPDQAMRIRLQTFHRRFQACQQRADRLAGIGQGRQIDDAFDVIGVARLGHHRAAPGVPDQQYVAALSLQHATGRSDVVRQRSERILYRGDAIALVLQRADHARPAGAIGKCAMHQHDGGQALHRCGSCRAGREDRQGTQQGEAGVGR